MIMAKDAKSSFWTAVDLALTAQFSRHGSEEEKRSKLDHAGRIACVNLLIMLAIAAAPTIAMAQDQDQDLAAYRRFRQDRFSEVAKAHPDQAGDIAAAKARTNAALLAVPQRLNRIDAPTSIWGAAPAPVLIFDDPEAPRMVVIPAGEFTMGSSPYEQGHTMNEGPQRRVRIAYTFAVSMFPVTYPEMLFFAEETHRHAEKPCDPPTADTLPQGPHDWRAPGFAQTFRSPATCVGLDDARAYAAWLSAKTGHRYRLLSEAEYEYVERAETTSAYWWGGDRNAACAFANGRDLDAAPGNGKAEPIQCHDGAPFTAELGKHKPNLFGLFDTAGNVASWTSDCWTPNLRAVPIDGSTKLSRRCAAYVVRGGSWASTDLRSAVRSRALAGLVSPEVGFRLAREL